MNKSSKGEVFLWLYKVGNKGLRREEQNKFSKKVTSSGDWIWDSCVDSDAFLSELT